MADTKISGEFPDSQSPGTKLRPGSPEPKDLYDDEIPLSPIVGYRHGRDGEVIKPSAWQGDDDGESMEDDEDGEDENEHIAEVPFDLNAVKPVHGGFTTASGKPVVVSEAALKKVKAMFAPEDVELLADPGGDQTVASSTATMMSMSEDKEVMECMEAFLMDGDDF